MRYTEGGFDIIAGRSGAGDLASLPMQRLHALRDDLMAIAGNYDRVIVDIGAGHDRTAKTLALPAGKGHGDTNDEPKRLNDAEACNKGNEAQGRGDDRRLVVNMAESAAQGGKTENKRGRGNV